VGQISPDKDMNLPCTTAAFTLSPAPAPGGLRHLVLTRPGTKPSMRFTRHIPVARPSGQLTLFKTVPCGLSLSVGSHVCARGYRSLRSLSPVGSWSPLRYGSSGQPLAGPPLPSASSYRLSNHGQSRYSYRGLSPHQFRPMPGVHK